MPRTFGKDPDAVLDYHWDWSAWLAGDTIASYTITPAAGLTVDSSSHTGTAVLLWLSGGTEGVIYPITCHIVTAAGREDDRTLMFAVQER